MVSRALSLATVTLLIGCFSAIPAQAENLEAGKSASQIFAGTCNACHKSPRGLLKSVSPGNLPGYLREHYTTSSDMAKQLAGFLISNGATDVRAAGAQAKDAKPNTPVEQLDRNGRKLRPGAPPQEAAKPEAPPVPAQAALAPDGRKKLGRRGRPGEEPPKTDAAPTGEPSGGEAVKEEAPKTEPGKEPGKTETAKTDAAKDTAKDAAKDEGGKPARPAGEGRSDTAAKETGPAVTPALRPDPVPPVTPAPPASQTPPTAVSSAPSEPPAPAPAVMTQAPAAPAVTASAPPEPAAAAPPAVPISQ
jgi:hypothetical protein